MRAANLKAGDALEGTSGYPSLITTIQTIAVAPHRVFNLNVDGVHTYRVGADALLVHNGCTDFPREVHIPEALGARANVPVAKFRGAKEDPVAATRLSDAMMAEMPDSQRFTLTREINGRRFLGKDGYQDSAATGSRNPEWGTGARESGTDSYFFWSNANGIMMGAAQEGKPLARSLLEQAQGWVSKSSGKGKGFESPKKASELDNLSTTIETRLQRGDDPVDLAADSGREMVRIRPFAAGNVRMAHLVMDYVLKRKGIAPSLTDHEVSTTIGPEQWRTEVRNGVDNHFKSVYRNWQGTPSKSSVAPADLAIPEARAARANVELTSSLDPPKDPIEASRLADEMLTKLPGRPRDELTNELNGRRFLGKQVYEYYQKKNVPNPEWGLTERERGEYVYLAWQDAAKLTAHAAQQGQPLTRGLLQEVHKKLMSFSLDEPYRGLVRHHPDLHGEWSDVTSLSSPGALRLLRANPDLTVAESSGKVHVHFAAPEVAGKRLDELLGSVETRLQRGDDAIDIAADSERQFIAIHPFLDGNGRTGRLIMDYVLARKGIAPSLPRHKTSTLVSPEEWRADVRTGVQDYFNIVYRKSQNWGSSRPMPGAMWTSKVPAARGYSAMGLPFR